jgi:hypothetical protein
VVSYSAYKLIHILGVFLVFFALGGLCLQAIQGGSTRGKKLAAITHGIGLLIVLVGGFGLLARIGISHGTSWPAWVWLKLGIWILMGGVTALLSKAPNLAISLWAILPLLGALAGYLAIYKPF